MALSMMLINKDEQMNKSLKIQLLIILVDLEYFYLPIKYLSIPLALFYLINI